jgi:peptide/nickel transport system permease protein
MPFKPVILWTDALLFLLLAAAIGFWLHMRSRPHLLQPWRNLVQSRQAMGSLVFLGFFIAVGLLDSVHFRPRLSQPDAAQESRYAVQTLSVVDVLVGPLRTRTEKTYSAPLATQLFSKETADRKDLLGTAGNATVFQGNRRASRWRPRTNLSAVNVWRRASFRSPD